MSGVPHDFDPSQGGRLDSLAEEFVERYRRGERPSVTEFAGRYPELADHAGELLRALAFMEEFRPEPDVAAARPSPPLHSVGGVPQQLGEYRLLREVGRGGMGVVYEAVQEPLGRRVALKVLPFHALLDSTQLERFRREARAAARLHHTNIVPVFGVGEHEGIHYYAMQFIEGRPLDAVLREVRHLRAQPAGAVGATAVGGAVPDIAQSVPSGRWRADALENAETPPVPGTRAAEPTVPDAPANTPPLASSAAGSRAYFRSVARVGLQAAEALAHAHAQGVLHRDIKPANLLLDAQGTVWVTDFGLAKAEGADNLTHTGDVVGTLRYMAPERLSGRSDVRGDVYGLGLTLYEMATLQPAFTETDRSRLIAQVTQAEPVRPRHLDRRVPRDLETIVLKAIAKEPELRYPSAGVMAEDLRRFIEDRPIEARRATLRERLWRWSRRNPALATVSALLCLALLAGFAGITWKSLEAQKQRDDAISQRLRAEEHRRRAFAAVDRMLTRVGDKELRHIPQMEQKRRQLLEDALGFYQQLLQDDSSDPQARLEVARAYIRVGNIQQWLGRSDQAGDAFRQGQEILEQLRSEFPDQAQHRFELALANRAMGTFDADLGQSAEAEALLLRSIRLLEDLDQEQPAKLENQRELAASHLALGNHYNRVRQYAKAETPFLSAVAIDEKLNQAFPEDVNNRQVLATAVGSLAMNYAETGREADAETTFLRAIDFWDEIIRDHPENDAFLASCDAACQNLGLLYRQLGRLEKAEQKYNRSLAICQQLAHLHPQVPVYKFRLGSAYQKMASLYRAMNRNTDAEAAYENALAVQEPLARAHPEVPQYRESLGIAYNNLGLFHWRANQNDKAEVAYEKALATHGELHQAYPDNLNYAANYASSCANVADLLRGSGKLELAVDKYAQAIEALENARKREPSSTDVRHFLFSAYWGRAITRVKADQLDKAKADWRRTVELSEGQANITMRIYRPLPLAFLGDYQRATREAETILAEIKVEPGVFLDYAGAFALASAAAGQDPQLPSAEREQLEERFALRALDMLARKKAVGRLSTAKQIEQLKTDRALESLRPRADFQQFVAESEAEIMPDLP
jgi:serine/threonine protein kinase/Tfp pilus assembly protein PilF